VSELVGEGYGFASLIEALTIFQSYGEVAWPTHCEHDELAVCVDPAKVPEGHKQRLHVLGFEPVSSSDHFVSYRFG